jgi:hypothetical protein
VILLDENIQEAQRLLLEQSLSSVRQVGVGVARKGLKDEQIVVVLRGLK